MWTTRSGEGTNLRQRRFVDAVDVRFGLRLHLLSQCFVADGAVHQRLHERTEAEEHKFQQESRPDTPAEEKHAHPVVPVATPRDVRRPFGTSCGFQVEVVIYERHAEARLQHRRQPVNPDDSCRGKAQLAEPTWMSDVDRLLRKTRCCWMLAWEWSFSRARSTPVFRDWERVL